MFLEYYIILIIKIASCLGQQYAFRSHSALANMMCSDEKVQFSTTFTNDIACVRECSLTQNCHAVIFSHANKTCFGLNTDNPFNVNISLPGAVFYKPKIAMSQRSTTPSTTTASTSTTAPTAVTTAPPTATTVLTTVTPASTTTSGCPTSSVSPVVFPPGVNSYGEEYPNNADETTTFTAPEGNRVLLTFGGVEIECYQHQIASCWSPDDGNSCLYDYLDILENCVSMTGRLCGTSPLYVYQSTASSVTVRFHTDGGVTYRGYQLDVAYEPAV